MTPAHQLAEKLTEARRYHVRPVTVTAAKAWVRQVHRDLPIIQGGLFAASVWNDQGAAAMGIAINPPRVWMDTGRIVIGRVAAIPGLEPVGDHAAPACTMIYGALCRAAKALGYREAWTYTLPGESGASLRAAGFRYMGETRGEEWDRPSRSRKPQAHPTKKGRWMRVLSAAPALKSKGPEHD